MEELEFHPLANIFPLMTDEELNDLGDDMLKHGQREPIIRFEGMILDGRNRHNACQIKDIEPRYIEYRGPDALAFVVSANLRRRQLNAGQRALVVEALATMRQGQRTDLKPSATIAKLDQATVAKLGKVSPRTISTAKALKRDAIPAVVDAVKRGDVPIGQAAAFAREVPPLDQARLVAEHGSPVDAVKAAVKAKADRAETKTPKPVPDPIPAADRAEETTAAKSGNISTLIDLMKWFERMRTPIEIHSAVAELRDDECTILAGHALGAAAWCRSVEILVDDHVHLVSARKRKAKGGATS